MTVMNKELQKHTIAERMSAMHVDPDTVDLESMVDSRLSLPENLRRASEKLNVSLSKNSVDKRMRKSSAEYFLKAEEIYNDWTTRRQRIDKKFRAENTFDSDTLRKSEFQRWREDPSNYDITRIDATKNSKPLTAFRGG